MSGAAIIITQAAIQREKREREQREQEEDKCPFCGAKADGYTHNGSQKHYCCGSWVPGELRNPKCYEAQIVALKTLVQERGKLLQRVTWRTKIHLSGCQCADCKAVEKVLNRPEDRAIMEGEEDPNHTNCTCFDGVGKCHDPYCPIHGKGINLVTIPQAIMEEE